MGQGLLDSASGFASQLGTSLKTLARVALKSRPVRMPEASGTDIVILGNGPSLAANLAADMPALSKSTTLAVNFFANSPQFFQVRPDYYVLADPHFFRNTSADANVNLLLDNLRKTDWPMTLFVPAGNQGIESLIDNRSITVRKFNFLRADGFHWLENLLWDCGAGMPRPRNVLIPSLMLAIAMGYRDITVLGADHGWLSTLSVTDDNRVVSVQPHFYKADKNEEKRVSAVYGTLRLDQVLESMTIAFRAYHSIERYARRKGARIYNATPGSMIDAFQRRNFTHDGNI